MERVAFQGVTNIVRFNWHFYLLSAALAGLAFWLGWKGPAWLIIVVTAISLLASFYIYDLSGLYRLDWLEDDATGNMVNIHAGFDETSQALAARFPSRALTVLDFYDPQKHPEPSIARARRAWPPYPGTIPVSTERIPLETQSAQSIYCIFAAHEIRQDEERAGFFRELHRVLAPSGQLIVVEHLRDWPNFGVYTLGFFHFLPAAAWKRTFQQAGFIISSNKKFTPFITVYTLQKNGMES